MLGLAAAHFTVTRIRLVIGETNLGVRVFHRPLDLQTVPLALHHGDISVRSLLHIRFFTFSSTQPPSRCPFSIAVMTTFSFVVTILLSLLTLGEAASSFSPARPPALPLAVKSPYLSTWVEAGSDGGNGGYLAGRWARHWA